jgi:hypothetical protein
MPPQSISVFLKFWFPDHRWFSAVCQVVRCDSPGGLQAVSEEKALQKFSDD